MTNLVTEKIVCYVVGLQLQWELYIYIAGTLIVKRFYHVNNVKYTVFTKKREICKGTTP